MVCMMNNNIKFESVVEESQIKKRLIIKIIWTMVLVVALIFAIICICLGAFVSIMPVVGLCMVISAKVYGNDRKQIVLADLTINDYGMIIVYHNIMFRRKRSDLIVEIKFENIKSIMYNDYLRRIDIVGSIEIRHGKHCIHRNKWILYTTDKKEEIYGILKEKNFNVSY